MVLRHGIGAHRRARRQPQGPRWRPPWHRIHRTDGAIATIPGLSRLARLANATVVPCVTRILPGSQGYAVEVGEPWADFPSDDVEADTRRMNAWIEAAVRGMPEQ